MRSCRPPTGGPRHVATQILTKQRIGLRYMEAFLYHFHGLGPFDFSSLRPSDLPDLQKLAAAQQLEIVPTIYLRREALADFSRTVKEYHLLQSDGLVPNIRGFAVEGPLLGPQGGIPRTGKWYPDGMEWEALATLGRYGLKYIVMAPDAMALEDSIESGLPFSQVLENFYDNGLRIAFGHFHRDDPERSAARLGEALEFIHSRYRTSPFLVLTDHLYNDMPRNFTHAWRKPTDQPRRTTELAPVVRADWENADLAGLLGPVPAAILTAARGGLLMPCLNFDGYHVDLEICRKTFDYLGEDRLIMLTDHTEVSVMAREELHLDKDSRLWLRDDGKVAAGTSDHRRQRTNMSAIGLTAPAIEKLLLTNAQLTIAYSVRRAGQKFLIAELISAPLPASTGSRWALTGVPTIILAAGEGTRLQPVTYHLAKALVPILNVPLLYWTVARSIAVGSTQLVTNRHFLADQIYAASARLKGQAGVDLITVLEPRLTGPAGGVVACRESLPAADCYLITNGDLWCDVDLADLVAVHRQSGADLTITAVAVPDPWRFGVLELSGAHVVAMHEKIRDPPVDVLVNAGIYVINPRALGLLSAPGDGVYDFRDVVPMLLTAGLSVMAYRSAACWRDIGDCGTYLEANLSALGSPAVALVATQATERLWVQGSRAAVAVSEIVGGAIIGHQALVADGALLDQAVIGPGASIGSGASVSRSVVMPCASVPSHHVVHDEIVL